MQRPRPDPLFRPYSLAPGWPIEIEVRCVDGGVPGPRCRHSVPLSACAELTMRVVVVDAVAQPLPPDLREVA